MLLVLLPKLRERARQRERPLPESVEHARRRFEHIWAVDGSTLEALFRKLKALKDVPAGQLAGKICSVIDLVTHLPVETWFREEAKDHDSNFLPHILAMAKAGVLFIFDRGFYDFTFFDDLIARGAHFIDRGDIRGYVCRRCTATALFLGADDRRGANVSLRRLVAGALPQHSHRLHCVGCQPACQLAESHR